MNTRHRLFSLAFRAIAASRVDRWAASLGQGRGAILTLHRVRPAGGDGFTPNGILEITPDFLDFALGHIRSTGFEIVALDEALARLASPQPGRFFVALTFDDGFRDTAETALPVLRRHGAPATVYAVPGFAERTAPMWWVDLEEAIRRVERVEAEIDGAPFTLPARTAEEKTQAFETIYWRLRDGPEERLRAVIATLACEAGHDSRATVEALCLDWDGLAHLAADPLITIGAHSMSHPRLAKLDEAAARAEIAGSRAAIESRLGRPVRHFAYPVGDPTSAGAREFRLAAELGFASAVTTRPGHVFAGHAAHPHALPRVSLNGLHQTEAALRALLSGLPFLALNRGRRLDVA